MGADSQGWVREGLVGTVDEGEDPQDEQRDRDQNEQAVEAEEEDNREDLPVTVSEEPRCPFR